MASSALPSLLLLLLALSVFSASARPCKTIFFYTTTTTTSLFPIFPQDSNGNPKLDVDPSKSPKFLTLFFTTVHTPHDVPNRGPVKFYFPTRPSEHFSFRSYPFPRFVGDKVSENQVQEIPAMPAKSYSSMTRGSISDRTRDIMSAVGAMLFGIGCGSLTAATMYLVWSLTSRYGSEDESDDDSVNGEDDNNSTPKKVGYVAIPDDDIDAIKKAAQAQAKMEAAGN